jgi:hypothetical protein
LLQRNNVKVVGLSNLGSTTIGLFRRQLVMDIKDQIKQEDRDAIRNLLTESQVLGVLLTERKNLFNMKINEIMRKVCKNPELYDFHINPQKDSWELNLKTLQVQRVNVGNAINQVRKNQSGVVK